MSFSAWLAKLLRELVYQEIRFGWAISQPIQIQKGELPMPLELTITNEQKIHVKLRPVTSSGRPAQLDGAAVFSSLSGEAISEVDSDGLGAYLISGDNPGDTQFLVEADADIGSGVVTVSDMILLHVQGANAAALGIVADQPETK